MTQYFINYNFEQLPGENPDQVAGYLMQQSNLPITAIHYPTQDNPYYGINANVSNEAGSGDTYNMINGAFEVCRAMIEIGKRRQDTPRYAVVLTLIEVDSAGKQTAVLGSSTTDAVSADLEGITISLNYVRETLGNCIYDHQDWEQLTNRYTGAPLSLEYED